jgi:hypothetical protein
MKASPSILLPILVGATGCHGPIFNFVAETTPDVTTVVRVTFETKKDTTATVQFGPDSLVYETLATESGTEHEVLLVGLPAQTESQFQIVTADGDESDVETVETGVVPNNFPALGVAGGGHDLFATLPVLGNVNGPVMLDPEGRYAWYHEDTSGLQVYRTRLRRDGLGFVYNVAEVSGAPVENSAIVKISFDGTEVSEIPIPLLAHDFVELEDGTIAALGFLYGPGADGEEILGNRLVEIAPDGTETEVWDTWDCYNPAVDFSSDKYGWTFSNAIDYDQATDSYQIGSRNLSSIASVNRETWTCDWIIGTAASATIVPDDPFVQEHQFEFKDGHLLVFDNDGGFNESRVIEYEVDLVAETATKIWTYDPNLYTFVLGDVKRLDNGDTMVTESASGQMERITAEGDSAWRVNVAEMGTIFGFADHVTDVYQPY